MPGTILENLSGRKLSVLVLIFLTCQLACFLVGLISPSPASSQGILSTVCIDDNPRQDNINRWFTRRCPKQVVLSDHHATDGLSANNLVSYYSHSICIFLILKIMTHKQTANFHLALSELLCAIFLELRVLSETFR